MSDPECQPRAIDSRGQFGTGGQPPGGADLPHQQVVLHQRLSGEQGWLRGPVVIGALRPQPFPESSSSFSAPILPAGTGYIQVLRLGAPGHSDFLKVAKTGPDSQVHGAKARCHTISRLRSWRLISTSRPSLVRTSTHMPMSSSRRSPLSVLVSFVTGSRAKSP